MHPETAADRANLLADFGEVIIASPAGGGPRFEFVAIFEQGPQAVSEFNLSDVATIEVVGRNTYLLARTDDLNRLDKHALIEIPSTPGTVWRVHSIERDEADGLFSAIQILEGAR